MEHIYLPYGWNWPYLFLQDADSVEYDDYKIAKSEKKQLKFVSLILILLGLLSAVSLLIGALTDVIIFNNTIVRVVSFTGLIVFFVAIIFVMARLKQNTKLIENYEFLNFDEIDFKGDEKGKQKTLEKRFIKDTVDKMSDAQYLNNEEALDQYSDLLDRLEEREFKYNKKQKKIVMETLREKYKREYLEFYKKKRKEGIAYLKGHISLEDPVSLKKFAKMIDVARNDVKAIFRQNTDLQESFYLEGENIHTKNLQSLDKGLNILGTRIDQHNSDELNNLFE